MIRRGIGLGSRLAAVAFAMALVLSLAGDRGRAATVPAIINGQDPLEVLSLKVRPNIIIVLDSSGSMTRTLDEGRLTNGDNPRAGDHPRSKMLQAKQVLRQVIANNEDKASFQYGQYTQYNISMSYQNAGDNRFQYVADERDFPSMQTGTELTVRRGVNDSSTSNRGLQSWQLIFDQWKTLHFEEIGGSVCSATLPGPFPKGYADGAVLAQDLENAMNTSSGAFFCSNTYTVSYNTGSGRFSFSATGPFNFRLLPNATPNNIEEALGGLPTSTASSGGGGGSVVVDWWFLRLRRNMYRRVYTNGPHGLSVGDTCTISGVPNSPYGAPSGFWNGTWSVTQIDNSTRFRLSGSTSHWSFWVFRPPSTGTVACTTSGGGTGTGTLQSGSPYTLLYRQTGYADSNNSLDTKWTFAEEIPSGSGTTVEFFQLRAGRFFNGEVVRVEADGDICDITLPTAAEKTNPPTVTLQLVANGCGADDPANRVTFSFAGGRFSGNFVGCRGFRSKSDLIPCDLQSPPAPTQLTMIGPYIDNELPLDANGDPADWDGDGNVDYVERMDGSWAVQTINVSPSSKAAGNTPIANSLIDIKGLADGSGACIINPPPAPGTFDRVDVPGIVGACVERGFAKLWNTGQAGATTQAGPAPWQLDPIKNHLDPKEKTIVLFVTDGDDTCYRRQNGGWGWANNNALRAAYWAEQLYRPINAVEPASSVQTYVIGYGGGATGQRLNWIAWGGSGLGQGNVGQPAIADNGNQWTEGTTSIANKRAQCTTCEDAFIAPDAATLAATIQGIIDQGASSGEFSAQQSITESIFEYVDLASNPPDTFDPRDPNTRYLAIVPTRIISSFTLPGFRGQVKAYQNDGFGNAVLKWSAGDTLQQLVSNGMANSTSPNFCDVNGTTGALLGECSFNQLHGSSALSAAAIQRRIYTTSRNGVYTFDAANLEAYGRGAWTPPERVTLWPPTSAIIPGNYTNEGILDEALGLPLDSTADPAGDFTTLQNAYGACVGADRPAGCTSGTASVRMKAARREAREMILAFMAGAASALDSTGGPKRASGSSGPVSNGDILYVARPWVLGDSEFATAAIVTQPLPSEPLATPWVGEYQLFRDGDGAVRSNSDGMLRQGYGLANPDSDATGSGNDPRNNLKPVMTVVYSPGNDMLHAFRAGPNVSPSTSCDEVANPTDECGGQELWGFVPFDQLGALSLRFINEPQGRDNHVFMLARGVRFSDVFVAAARPPINVTVGGVTHPVNGVWRRILYIPRGIGGKYITALDVTGPGAHTAAALATAGPIPLWSRGNPDTQDGTAGGTNSGTSLDRLAYREMGETWSMPSVVYRDKTTNTSRLYNTRRRPAPGIDYALYMGSGYGAAGEGSTFFTLDALSGDVIAAADVEAVASANGLTRTTLSYPNALVANAVGFNPAVFSLLQTVHPAASAPTRVYIGDIHGRLWKFLTARPEVAIPVADLGEDQPIGTAVSLLGMPPQPDVPVPFVYAVAGNDSRADEPFNMFGFRDDGTDTQIAIGSGVVANGVTTFPPMVSIHTRVFDQGTPLASCGYTEEAVFRGTIQPATAFECSAIVTGDCQNPVGRVFFGGTRLSLPNTVFAPPTPLACGTGDYPCRSSFDSIIYALGAKTGLAAYDLNSSGDDAYRIFRDNRISAIGMQADPDPASGGSSFNTDEGEMKGTPKPPPPPGVPPTATTATANVVMERVPGQAPPSVHYGSTVCQ